MYSCSGHGILEFNNVIALSVDNILGDTTLLSLACWQNQC